MNIIVVALDNLRRDFLSCYGNDWIHTPNLERFAQAATVFTHAYTGSYPTIPMRADMWTGLYHFQSTGWSPLPAQETIFSNVISLAGYISMMIADNYHLFEPGMNFHRGFAGWRWIRGQEADPYITDPISVELPCSPNKLRQPQTLVIPYLRNNAYRKHERDWAGVRTMREAIDWLELNYTHEKFLLYIDSFECHEPWVPPRWYVDLYDPGYEGEEVIYPNYAIGDFLTDSELRHTTALYAGEITLMDKWIGNLLQKVKDLGIWEKTAVMFLSDHGIHLGDHDRVGKHALPPPVLGENLSGSSAKHNIPVTEPWPLYEELAHIPLIIRLPGQAEGQICSALVQPIDIMPTILDIAGCPIPQDLHGQSLLPLLKGEKGQIRSCAVSSYWLSPSRHQMSFSTITDDEWCLIYADEDVPAELYHLPSDSQQENDVISDNREIAERLHGRYCNLLGQIGTSKEKLSIRSKLKI